MMTAIMAGGGRFPHGECGPAGGVGGCSIKWACGWRGGESGRRGVNDRRGGGGGFCRSLGVSPVGAGRKGAVRVRGFSEREGRAGRGRPYQPLSRWFDHKELVGRERERERWALVDILGSGNVATEALSLSSLSSLPPMSPRGTKYIRDASANGNDLLRSLSKYTPRV